MIRALIAAALVVGATIHFGAPVGATLGYGLILCLTLWFIWPLLRRLRRFVRRGRRAALRRAVAAPERAASAPSLTQINHYHYYGRTTPPPATQQSGPTLLALSRRARQQNLHDTIYNPHGPAT